MSKKYKKHISTKAFVSRLIELGINHSTDYYEKISGLYDEIFVIDPVEHYAGFNWNLLIQNTEVPYDETDLHTIINKILDIIFLNFIRRCIISLFSLNQRIQSGLRLLSSLHLPPWLPSSLLSFAHKQFAPDPA